MIKFVSLLENINEINWSTKTWREDDKFYEPLGYVPMQGEVDYRGLSAKITPRNFHRLAKMRSYKDSNLEFIIQKMKEGFPIAPPFLQIEIKGDKISVYGHEGRTRTQAAKTINGNELIPVHLFVYVDGNKLVNRNKEMVDKVLFDLKFGLWSENGYDFVDKPFVDLKAGT